MEKIHLTKCKDPEGHFNNFPLQKKKKKKENEFGEV